MDWEEKDQDGLKSVPRELETAQTGNEALFKFLRILFTSHETEIRKNKKELL